MEPIAVALVLAAAVGHASWNLLAKRVGGGAAFVWLVSAIGVAVYAPAAAAQLALDRPELNMEAGAVIGASAVLQTGYFLSLQRAYRVGDLSLVYPLARGSGPLLALVGAVCLLGERPAPLAVGGALLVAVGTFWLAGDARAVGWGGPAGTGRPHRQAVVFALLTGVFLAGYTLVDKLAVGTYGLPPLLAHWGTLAGITALTAPLALRRAGLVRTLWRDHWRESIVVGLLSPLTYVLVLTALALAPVSYVAPAREVSILFGALLGGRALGEAAAARRVGAAATLVAGVFVLAMS